MERSSPEEAAACDSPPELDGLTAFRWPERNTPAVAQRASDRASGTLIARPADPAEASQP